MEAIELEALGGKHLRGGRAAWAAECAGGAEAGVVDQDDQDVGSAIGWAQLVDRRVLVFGVFRVVEDEPRTRLIRDWKHCSLNVLRTHRFLLRIKSISALVVMGVSLSGVTCFFNLGGDEISRP